MIQFDANLEYAIFREAYQASLNSLKEDLAKRKELIRWVYERKNLTADQIKKTNLEEKHIDTVVDYILRTEGLIETLIGLLVNRRQDQIDWHDELMREQEMSIQFTHAMILKYQKLKSSERKGY